MQHRLRPRYGPTHPSLLHSILHQVAAGSLGHPATDRKAGLQILVIPHVLPVVLQVRDHRVQRLATRTAQLMLGQPLAKSADYMADSPFQQPSKSIRHELLGLVAPLGVEAMRRGPEPLHDME